MTDTEQAIGELTRALQIAAEENHALRAQIEAQAAEIAGRQSGQPQPGGITDHALCRGCYRWKLALAALAGGALAGVAEAALDANKAALDALAGSPQDAATLKAIIMAASGVAPLLTTVIEWKWKLYGAGYAGVFRAIAELRAAFKKGLGRQ